VWRWSRRRSADESDDAHWHDLRSELIDDSQTRQRLLAGKEGLVASLEALLFRHDPIGINFGHNTDEYRPEAETIALRLPEAATEGDLERIIHEEFVHWFADLAGPADRYAPIAREAWPILLTYR
jgi:glyoxylase-like metal-dependent hydrolase (beta-lactamase superfamily II)